MMFFRSLIILFIMMPFALFALRDRLIEVGAILLEEDYSRNGGSSLVNSRDHGFLYGGYIGYEILMPDQVYGGISGNILTGKTSHDHFIIKAPSFNVIPFQGETNNLLINLDVRLGYTFGTSCCLFSPFIGLGWFAWNRNISTFPYAYKEKLEWKYYSTGFRLVYSLMEKIDIGLNAKLLLTCKGRIKAFSSDEYRFRLPEQMQWEIETPLNYYLDKKIWIFDSFRVTPFYQNLSFGKSGSIFTDFEFSIPGGTMNIFGVRFSLITHFQ